MVADGLKFPMVCAGLDCWGYGCVMFELSDSRVYVRPWAAQGRRHFTRRVEDNAPYRGRTTACMDARPP